MALRSIPLAIPSPEELRLPPVLSAICELPQGFVLVTGPTGSGKYMTLFEVAKEIGCRLSSIFLRDESGKRPVYGGTKKFQEDPYWKDYILFHEYFHGDYGAGLGASHQTGWTGTIARVLDLFARIDPAELLREPKNMLAMITREQVEGK